MKNKIIIYVKGLVKCQARTEVIYSISGSLSDRSQGLVSS